jgi:hypothetical protein
MPISIVISQLLQLEFVEIQGAHELRKCEEEKSNDLSLPCVMCCASDQRTETVLVCGHSSTGRSCSFFFTPVQHLLRLEPGERTLIPLRLWIHYNPLGKHGVALSWVLLNLCICATC